MIRDYTIRASRLQAISDASKERVKKTKSFFFQSTAWDDVVKPFLAYAERQLDEAAAVHQTSATITTPSHSLLNDWDWFTAFCEVVQNYCVDIEVQGDFSTKTIRFSWQLLVFTRRQYL